MNSYMDYLSSYNDFLMKEMTMQGHMMDCIEEAVCIAEGTTYVHEGIIVDKIKEIWNKFIQFINKIFSKFQAIYRAIDPTKYLETYVNIITKEPMKFRDVKMLQYDFKAIASIHAEKFDLNALDKMVAGNKTYLAAKKDELGFVNQTPDTDDMEVIREYIRKEMLHGEVDEVNYEVPSSHPALSNMTDVYWYLHDFKKKTEPALTKDKDTVASSSNVIQQLLNEAKKSEDMQARDKAAAEAEKKATQPPTPADAASSGAPPTAQVNSYINLNTSFKSILEMEVGDKRGTGGTGGASPTSNKVNAAGGSTPAQNTEDRFSTNVKGVSGSGTEKSDANKDYLIKGKYTSKQIQDAITTYSNINGAIVDIKYQLCDQAYRDLMTIVKLHVRGSVGEERKGGDVAQGATSYRNPQSQKIQQQQQAKPAADQNAQNAAGAANAAINGQGQQ